MRMVATAVIALAISMASTAWAQSPAQPISPEKLSLARQVMAASGGEKQMESIMGAMSGAMFRGMAQAASPAQQALMNTIQQDMQAEMIKTTPSLLDASAHIYAENLTDKEMQDELAWLQSDSGQSIRRKTPMMMQEMASTTVPIIQKAVPAMLKRVIDDACAQHHCTAQDREKFDAAITKAMTKQGA
jgi:uncharacterized protein